MQPYDTSWTDIKSVDNREYTNIYVIKNTEDPIGDTIKLGYISDVEDVLLKKGKFSYFHFPMKDIDPYVYNPEYSVPISATTLINNGATYGSSPYKSDRIYRMRSDYPNTSPYGKTFPDWHNNGKWLCSWLSGDVLDRNTKPIWCDRWFNPKKIDLNAASLADSKDTDTVRDIPSEMTMDHGSYYKYWHVGENTISGIVDSIGVGDSLKMHFYDWEMSVSSHDENNRVTYYNIDSKSLNNYRVSDDFEDGLYAITFNGKNQYATIPYSDEMGHVTRSEYSIVSWVKCDDWKNCTSYGILDNMFKGGWRFGVTNRADTPFIFLFGNDENNAIQNGTSCILNTNGDLVSTKAYWKSDDNVEIKDMIVDLDNYVFVLDYDVVNNRSRIRKIDHYGNQLGIKVYEGVEYEYIDITAMRNRTEGDGFYSNRGANLLVYKVDGNTISGKELNRYTLEDKNMNGASNTAANGVMEYGGEFFVYKHNDFVVCDNGKETIEGKVLDSDGKWKAYSFGHMIGVKSVIADYDNNVWVLKDDVVEKYSVIYHAYRLSRSFKIKKGIDPILIDLACRNIDGKNVDVVLVVSGKKQCVYAYDTEGNVIDSYDTSKFYVKPCNLRRCTSYDWYRMSRNVTDCVYFDVMDSVGHNRIVKKLDECSDVEWHQIGAVVRYNKNKNDSYMYTAEFYFDCRLVGKASIKGRSEQNVNVSTVYRFDSPIVIGGSCGKFFPLKEEILVNNCSFLGSIDDIRIYSRPITAEDMYYIYMSKYRCDDMTWHIKNENRNYVENVERTYKFKMPGSKSAHYELYIRGYKKDGSPVDETVKSKIEDIIGEAVKRNEPAYTALTKIVWD